MKLNKRKSALVAFGLAGAMLLSACGGDDNDSGGSSSADGGGSFSMYIGEPQNALVPGNTTESEGDQVVKASAPAYAASARPATTSPKPTYATSTPSPTTSATCSAATTRSSSPR